MHDLPLVHSLIPTQTRFFGVIACLFATCAALGQEASSAPEDTPEQRLFQSVLSELDTDGDFLTYLNVQGDVVEMSSGLTEAYIAYLTSKPGRLPIPIRFDFLVERLGLTQIRAVGLSSRPRAMADYRNILFAETGGDQRGLLRIFGSGETRFLGALSAPVEADLVAEFRLSPQEWLESARTVAASILGNAGVTLLNEWMNAAPENDGAMTFTELAALLDTSCTLMLDLKPGTDPVDFDFALRADGAGEAADALSLRASSASRPRARIAKGRFEGYVVQGIEFRDSKIDVFFVQHQGTGDLWISSGPRFLEVATGDGPALGTDPAFRRLVSGLPRSGSFFLYTSETWAAEQRRKLSHTDSRSTPAAALSAHIQSQLAGRLGAEAWVVFPTVTGIKMIGHSPLSWKERATLLALPTAQ